MDPTSHTHQSYPIFGYVRKMCNTIDLIDADKWIESCKPLKRVVH